ncbi:MAG: putative metal-binding motif-containing protein [Deltaproteobacteria bacterium]|nr:putative metal-binding motif-containing protein [Deltaproteobacteria bacterium]
MARNCGNDRGIPARAAVAAALIVIACTGACGGASDRGPGPDAQGPGIDAAEAGAEAEPGPGDPGEGEGREDADRDAAGDAATDSGGDARSDSPDAPCADGVVWYRDADGDKYGVPDAFALVCPGEDPPEGHVVAKAGGFDCDDADPDRHPNAEEACDGKDNDCDGLVDNRPSKPCVITNAFGSCAGKESCSGQELICYAATPAPEACNGLDDDCDGDTDGGLVAERQCGSTELGECRFGVEHRWCEGGEWTAWQGCDAVMPAAVETCDGKDDDCDGETDEGLLQPYWPDADGDGWGWGGQPVLACGPPPGAVAAGGDCNDADAFVNPGASETCNGKDDDCDGTPDEGVKKTYFTDADEDGYGDPGSTVEACSKPAGTAVEAGDCDDSRGAVHPGAAEACAGGIDEDCDGATDCEDDACAGDGAAVGGVGCTPWYADADGDGLGLDGTGRCSCAPDPASGHVAGVGGDCDDTVVQCTLDCVTDADKDGIPDCADGCRDMDRDGYGETVACGGTGCSSPCPAADCDDATASVHPGAAEACNGEDDDCDLLTDEAFADKGKACDGPDPDSCETGVWVCAPGGDGLECAFEQRDACEGRECGPDGCGGSCGECAAHPNSFCAGAACGCAADSCDSLGRECGGGVSDGCGGEVACGPCGQGFACDGAYKCACPSGVICFKTCCKAGETCNAGTCKAGTADPSGAYAISPAPYYKCTFGLVTVSFNQLTFADSGTSLTVSPAPNQASNCCSMVGDSAKDGSFSVTCTCPGGCAETYTLTGTYSEPGKKWSGKFEAKFSGPDCLVFDPCYGYAVNVTGTKP